MACLSDANLSNGMTFGGVTAPGMGCSLAAHSDKHSTNDICFLDLLAFYQDMWRNKIGTMDDINADIIEKFSKLQLKSSSNIKDKTLQKSNLAKKYIDIDEISVPDSKCELKNLLPVAQISIKENGRQTVCLNCISEKNDCCKKTELNSIVNEKDKDESKSVSVTSNGLLIARAPHRNGRIHCKIRTDPRQANGIAPISVNEFPTYPVDIALFSPPAAFSPPSQRRLHGSGGTYSETIVSLSSPEMDAANLHRNHNNMLLSQSLSPSGTDESSLSDQLSQLTYYPSPSSSTSDMCLGTAQTPIPSSVSTLFPTPPHSGDESTFSYSDIGSPLFSSLNNSILSFDDYDSPIEIPSPEDILPSFSDEPSESLIQNDNALFTSNAVQNKNDEIQQIRRFLEDGSFRENPFLTHLISQPNGRLGNSSDVPIGGDSFVLTNKESSQQLDRMQSLSTIQMPSTGDSSQLSSHQVPIYISSNETNVLRSTISVIKGKQLESTQGCKHIAKLRPILPKSDISHGGLPLPPAKETSNSSRNGIHLPVRSKIRSRIHPTEKKKIVREILPDPFAPIDDEGRTKLHLAALEGNEKLAYIIIETKRISLKSSKSNRIPELLQDVVDAKDNHDRTPLYYAAGGKNNLLIAYLLECGANPFINDQINGDSPFHVAVREGDEAIIRLALLSYRRDAADVKNNRNETILHAAVLNYGKEHKGVQIKRTELIKHLLSNGHKLCSQDSDGRTVLHMAVQQKNIELLEVLLKHGSDAKEAKLLQDCEGNTMLHLAAIIDLESENHRKLITTIIGHCPKLTEMKNKNGKFPYEMINENKDQLKELLQSRWEDEHGWC